MCGLFSSTKFIRENVCILLKITPLPKSSMRPPLRELAQCTAEAGVTNVAAAAGTWKRNLSQGRRRLRDKTATRIAIEQHEFPKKISLRRVEPALSIICIKKQKQVQLQCLLKINLVKNAAWRTSNFGTEISTLSTIWETTKVTAEIFLRIPNSQRFAVE